MDPHPLQWPEGWPRSRNRVASKFTERPLGQMRDELLAELGRMRARSVVLSTNFPVRGDGLFYATTPRIEDHGVAVYFHWRGSPHVVACDHYRRLWENVRAITKTIEAMRTIERHGSSQLLERAVSGFRALGPGEEEAEPEEPWWEVFGVTEIAGIAASEIAATPDHPMRRPLLGLVETVYKTEIQRHHVDKGGDPEKTISLNRAIGSARTQLGATDG